MSTTDNQSTDKVRDSGFQVEVRKTFPVDAKTAWQELTSAEGLYCWLGDISYIGQNKGDTYELPDGTKGKTRVYRNNSHLLITWQPPEWDEPSVIQVRVIPKSNKSVIAFHQEQLPSEDIREERRMYFENALENLEELFRAESG